MHRDGLHGCTVVLCAVSTKAKTGGRLYQRARREKFGPAPSVTSVAAVHRADASTAQKLATPLAPRAHAPQAASCSSHLRVLPVCEGEGRCHPRLIHTRRNGECDVFDACCVVLAASLNMRLHHRVTFTLQFSEAPLHTTGFPYFTPHACCRRQRGSFFVAPAFVLLIWQ